MNVYVAVAQSKVISRVTALNLMQFSLEFCHLNYFRLCNFHWSQTREPVEITVQIPVLCMI